MQRNDPLKSIVLAYISARVNLSLEGGTERTPDGATLAVSGAPVASLNAVISPDLDPDAKTMETLAGSEALAGLPWSLNVRGRPKAGVIDVARRHGLTHTTVLPLMIRYPQAGQPAVDNGVLVRPVDGDEMTVYARALADGWGVPHEVFALFANPALADTEGFTFYLAESDGELVGTGMAAVQGDLLGVFNIGVLPRYRRQGHGKAITTEIVRAHYAEGATTAYLYSSPMGESVYAAAGFKEQEVLTMFMAPS
ncbi:GNAT family N-acetyltransferase [[Kitasatospora] papulosa]|uniref:GNAT family N-acetyltransferase n=1 Tax=[Kitasatospora] papulosa TaxID=1464011 RepID=UPI003694B2F8